MRAMIVLLSMAVLAGCAGKTAYRDNCASELDAGWKEQSLAEAEGFAGTVSYSKAITLLSAAKTQQQFEGFRGCVNKAKRARFYLKESRAGR